MMNKFLVIIGLFLLCTLSTQAQNSKVEEKKHFIGSTLFMLANFAPESPQYYQLNFGYRISPKNVITLEAITWTYKGPLGRSYGKDFENPDSDFPGTVQAFGAGLSYKRFIWKDAYLQFHSTALHQNYLDLSKNKIQSGFQLFNTLRAGYQFQLFNKRIFIEPSIACTFWPVNTNLPESFQVKENQFPIFFVGEPGLHFGINF